MLLNKINKPNSPLPTWINEATRLIQRARDSDKARAFTELSTLFTIYDLVTEYPKRFESILDWYCRRSNTSLSFFLNLINIHQREYQDLKNSLNPLINGIDIKNLRNNKKLHFYINSGTVKLSTIHSFKGWESETIFLIVEENNANIEATFDEVLYTGLKRSKKNLIIINFGNQGYDLKLKELIKSINE